jgi:hypothetical protein
MPTLSETFWIAFVATASGFLLKLASMMYKSKCTECSLCGITIKRDVLTEEREHEYDVAHQLQKIKSSTKLEDV